MAGVDGTVGRSSYVQQGSVFFPQGPPLSCPGATPNRTQLNRCYSGRSTQMVLLLCCASPLPASRRPRSRGLVPRFFSFGRVVLPACRDIVINTKQPQLLPRVWAGSNSNSHRSSPFFPSPTPFGRSHRTFPSPANPHPFGAAGMAVAPLSSAGVAPSGAGADEEPSPTILRGRGDRPGRPASALRDPGPSSAPSVVCDQR